jgi:hypothetical protein
VATAPLRLSLSCVELGVAARGSIDSAVAGRVFDGEPTRELDLLHCKRDGTACFAYVDELTGIETGEDVRGRPGDVFAFGGDPERTGRERLGQLVLVYGEDNLFVEPFDAGVVPRRYTRVGRIDDVEQLVRLGDAVWRRGAHRVELSVAHP